MKNKIVFKTGLMFLFISMFLLSHSNIFANSAEFINMIGVLGVPRYNSNKEEINEDVYKIYKVFCYSAPEKYKGKDPAQRWKDSKYGLWNKSGGAYKGTGTRGEYLILGKNYGGAVLSNYYFPLDAISPDTPDKWNYRINSGALESWTNGKAYLFTEQRDFMKYSKLVFNDLSSRDNADNPAKFKEYNITPNTIGLDRVKLETSSSWKTRGVVSVKFIRNGNLRYAFFFTNPIAANANVKSSVVTSSNNYNIKEKEKEIIIPIDYSSLATNLTRIC